LEILWQPQPRQKLVIECPFAEVLYGGAAGGGKELSIDTPIPTPHGFTPIGDIVAGDIVFDESGNQCRVVTAFPIEIGAKAFRVTFDDGSSLIASGDHRWFTYTVSDLTKLQRRTDDFREKRRRSRESKAKGNKSEKFVSSITLANSARHSISNEPIGSVKTTKEILDTITVRGGRLNHAIPVTSPLSLVSSQLPIPPLYPGGLAWGWLKGWWQVLRY